MIFDPQRAAEKLKKAIYDIEKLSTALNDLRLRHATALASLRDKEQKVYSEYFADTTKIKATVFRDWLKWQTMTESMEEEKIKNEIRRVQGLYDTQIEIVNAIKFTGRMLETQLHNLPQT